MSHAKLIYGLIGRAVDYSLSPLIHNTAFSLLGIEACYTIFNIASPEEVPVALKGMRALGIAGCNVTIPYKAAVVPSLDALSDDARSIGAVNTIVNENGRLTGHNTDIAGFAAPLLPQKAALFGRPAVMFGNGGAALAAIEALMRHFSPSSLTVFVRDPATARDRLLPYIQKGFVELARQDDLFGGDESAMNICREAALIINATPKGTYGRPDAMESIIPTGAGLLHSGQTVYDMVYNPEHTPLLAAAKAAGANTVPGIAMLLAQAARSFQLWTGHEMPARDIEPIVLHELQLQRSR
ncbi:shikimate dehydrogenase [Pelodictyon luteolum]|uniref:Shikimate dehydrogenase (NADP(+)) n=1 Tax=Chlorobium luteolum (strain DSM 273 / BCRC 81028 / 2530) TaxID=319225 RepID=Q3B5L0_CHLL3|nr:shikimate dehydrogenase [Pelodictyon luteolum]ABB23371.1 shikimate dehydrogenase [Pelodictyon luteolum DSM 273]